MRTAIIAQRIPTIVPVLDLKGGRAVHAVGGRREHYQAVRSVLHPGSDPLGLARAFYERLGLDTVYVADLDAIAGGPPAFWLYEKLRAARIACWVDAGLRNTAGLDGLLDAGVSTFVAGSETVDGPAAVGDLLARLGPERLVFSLDLKAGRPLLAHAAAWGQTDARAIANDVVGRGVRRLLVLDLTRVGRGLGLGSLPLVAELTHGRPVEVAVGGGISGRDDLERAGRAGASAALVGTALHTGAIVLSGGALVDDR